MSTLDERAQQIFTFLARRKGQKFTLAALCQRTGLQPGQKTVAAIRRARDIATENGLNFPPAVVQNGYTYSIIKDVEDAYDPGMQMDRIADGVRRRADVQFGYIERHQAQIPADIRPQVMGIVQIRREVQRSAAALERIYQDTLVATMKARRQERGN